MLLYFLSAFLPFCFWCCRCCCCSCGCSYSRRLATPFAEGELHQKYSRIFSCYDYMYNNLGTVCSSLLHIHMEIAYLSEHRNRMWSGMEWNCAGSSKVRPNNERPFGFSIDYIKEFRLSWFRCLSIADLVNGFVDVFHLNSNLAFDRCRFRNTNENWKFTLIYIMQKATQYMHIILCMAVCVVKLKAYSMSTNIIECKVQ